MTCDPLYRSIPGHVVITGYAPDGDSVRFVPSDPSRLASLERSSLIRTSATDGSVQLRLEGIDAPELHYESAAQPRGACARDALLALLGVRAVRYAPGGTVVTEAHGDRAPVTVLARMADRHGRVIAYVLRASARRPAHEPMRRRASTLVVRQSLNFALVAHGDAYPLAYTSQPPEHRRAFRGAAREARRMRLGVWRDDASLRGFSLHGGARALGPSGVLVVPKLFRRAVDYLACRHREGFRGAFVEWLRGAVDRVVLAHAANVPFATLVREARDGSGRIALACDPTSLVFVES